MGVKEEKLPFRILLGHSGQSRPLQATGGMCLMCHLEVWIEPPGGQGEFQGTKVLHYGCKDAYEERPVSPPLAKSHLNGSGATVPKAG